MDIKEVKIEDLQVGDEILVGSQSSIRKYTILRPIQKAKVQKAWHTKIGKITYKATKIATRMEIEKFTHTWNGKSYERTIKKYRIAPKEENNHEMYVSLQDRTLIKVN